MKEIAMPPDFDGAKYEKATGIRPSARINDQGQRVLVLPDDAPAPDASHNVDAQPVKPQASIDAIKAGSINPADHAAVLKWLIETRRI